MEHFTQGIMPTPLDIGSQRVLARDLSPGEINAILRARAKAEDDAWHTIIQSLGLTEYGSNQEEAAFNGYIITYQIRTQEIGQLEIWRTNRN